MMRANGYTLSTKIGNWRDEKIQLEITVGGTSCY